MSSESLSVELNEERPHDLSVAPSFSADGPFEIELDNLGQAIHVHLNIDDELSRVARLSGGNHYVDGGQTLGVEVFVTPNDEPVTGKLKIVTGYGSETAYVDVTINPAPETRQVDVDDTLSKPTQKEAEPSVSEGLSDVFPDVDPSSIPLFLLGVFALALAVGIATVFDSFAITLGAGVVVGGVIVALGISVLG
ncbi:hypothetical protein KU306_10340 [Haloferax larsenii]|uniref:Uncharacterized protein n=1 Tax=Haloferax larsenii TaxID=302484 RepID=A0ABY5RAX4_HALLR|nr:hypothetical protein [Haloferax larsenii]ELZ82893.1 hypothetical protein C455_01943 [Haloferax larsenii JCM 13917]UVE49324.1 hypothetical protein KU306_10340 [Haloferax larsenii]